MKRTLVTALLAACAALSFSCTDEGSSTNFWWGYIDPGDYTTKTIPSKSFTITAYGSRSGDNVNAIYSKYIYPSTSILLVYEVVGVNSKGFSPAGFKLKMYRLLGIPGGAWTLHIITATGVGYSYTVPDSDVTIAKDSPSAGLCTITFNTTLQTGVVEATNNIVAQIYTY